MSAARQTASVITFLPGPQSAKRPPRRRKRCRGEESRQASGQRGLTRAWDRPGGAPAPAPAGRPAAAVLTLSELRLTRAGVVAATSQSLPRNPLSGRGRWGPCEQSAGRSLLRAWMGSGGSVGSASPLLALPAARPPSHTPEAEAGRGRGPASRGGGGEGRKITFSTNN